MKLKFPARSDRGSFKRRINRAPSPLLAFGLPWLSIMLASVLTTIVTIASAPVMPPLGFLTYIAWRQLRPGLLPVWAGIPLGVVDDLFSGQPFGSAVLLWSLAAIALEVVEARLPWRNFIVEWLLAAVLIVAYIGLGLLIANLTEASTPLFSVAPQTLISFLVFPFLGRVVAQIDRLRLTPVLEMK